MIPILHRFFGRPERPRLLGHRRPFFSPEAADCFTRLGAASLRATSDACSETTRELALHEMGRVFQECQLRANDPLLEAARHLCLATQAHTRGDTGQAAVDQARGDFFKAAREALGNDN